MSRNIVLACSDISARAVVCDARMALLEPSDVLDVLMRCGHTMQCNATAHDAVRPTRARYSAIRSADQTAPNKSSRTATAM